MRIGKFKRKIQEFLDKYGDIPVVNKIDFWYRETYEDRKDWKVRETIMLSDYLDIETLDGIEPYDLLKTLEHPNGKLPFKVSVEYADSKERYEQQNAEHPEEEKRKSERINNCAELFKTYYRYADCVVSQEMEIKALMKNGVYTEKGIKHDFNIFP